MIAMARAMAAAMSAFESPIGVTDAVSAHGELGVVSFGTLTSTRTCRI